MRHLFVFCITWGTLAAVAEPVPPGTESWGGIKPLPAVVNEVGQGASPNLISLRGEWTFTARSSGAQGLNGCCGYKGFAREEKWDGTRKIQVPACWEAQGVGEPHMSVPWDQIYDQNMKPVRHFYIGEAWYRKEVQIPASWAGKRVWLKIGGVKSQGFFFVNDHQVGFVCNYCGTYKYDVTPFVTPGQMAKVVVQVRNDVPSRKGLFSAMNRWGGLYRDVELEATPEARIDDVWVRGDFDKGEAEAHVTVGGGTGKIRVTVEGQSAEADAVTNGETVVRLPLKDFRAWSPEHPNLYWAEIALLDKGGAVVHMRRERFGIRKLEVRGKEIWLNNHPYYFRGFGDDHVYPITGMTPPDRAEHLKHLMKAHEAGFNFVRLHTHCELPEYFEAADEAGILIQVEMPYYCNLTCEAFEFDPGRDIDELYRNFRRYPSFAVYCCGNEGSFGPALSKRLYQWVKATDPDRLMIHQDGGDNTPENSDYDNGPINVWARGSVNPNRPFVTHEYLNLSVKQDSRLEPLYKGVWEVPVTRAKRAEWLGKSGLDLGWGDALQDAQHGLQRISQKRGIEAARADPYCDGHCFWTIVDVVVEYCGTYSAQGLLDPFWQVKRNGATLEEFRQFNGPSAVLLDTEPNGRVFTSGDTLKASFLFANFDAPIEQGVLKWSFAGTEHSAAVGRQDIGNARKVAESAIAVPEVTKPEKVMLTASLGTATNSWEFWVFPKRTVRDGRGIAVEKSLMPALSKLYSGLTGDAEGAALIIAPYGSMMAENALEEGKRVITIFGANGKPNVSLGWWAMGRQVGTAFAKGNPALGALPHEGYLSPLMFRLVKDTGLKLPLAGLDKSDMVVVGEGGDACYLYLGAANILKGKALMAFGLDVLSGTPEGTAVLDGMIDAARREDFAPKGTVSVPILRKQNGWARTLKLGAGDADDLPIGATRNVVARGSAGRNELEWETEALPAGLRGKPTFAITWAGGMGYPGQPVTTFTLSLNGKALMELPGAVWEDRTWTGNGCTLTYNKDKDTPEYGVFTLTVPSAMLEPGKAAVLKVTGSDSGSLMWMGVFER
jgi:beta-galactosidase